MAAKTPKYLEVDKCPCPFEVAAQVKMVLNTAHQTASAIYRGTDPAAQPILKKNGKHNQTQLYEVSIHGPVSERIRLGLPPGGGGVNQPGRSEHECKSDGVGKAGPIGRDLPKWQVGVDSGSNTTHDRAAVEIAARKLGWVVHHHYDTETEFHHWCFDEPPKPRGGIRGVWTRSRIAYWQKRLPR